MRQNKNQNEHAMQHRAYTWNNKSEAAELQKVWRSKPNWITTSSDIWHAIESNIVYMQVVLQKRGACYSGLRRSSQKVQNLKVTSIIEGWYSEAKTCFGNRRTCRKTEGEQLSLAFSGALLDPWNTLCTLQHTVLFMTQADSIPPSTHLHIEKDTEGDSVKAQPGLWCNLQEDP